MHRAQVNEEDRRKSEESVFSLALAMPTVKIEFQAHTYRLNCIFDAHLVLCAPRNVQVLEQNLATSELLMANSLT